VSANTREPRPGETNGRDYWFMTREEFLALREAGGFLESFDVYGDLKGTPRAPIEEHLASGDDVLLELDVQGALALREAYPGAFLVFVKPPSRDVQRRRLLERDGPSDPETLARRLARADEEEALADRFDAVVVNDDLGRAVGEVAAILEGRRLDG
jgi:guanylate kinase